MAQFPMDYVLSPWPIFCAMLGKVKLYASCNCHAYVCTNYYNTIMLCGLFFAGKRNL